MRKGFLGELPGRLAYILLVGLLTGFAITSLGRAITDILVNKSSNMFYGISAGFTIGFFFFVFLDKRHTRKLIKENAVMKELAERCVEAYRMYQSCESSGMLEDAEFYKRRYEELRVEVIGLLGKGRESGR